MEEIRILVADDHNLTRKGVRALLSGQNEFKAVIEEASSGAEVVDLTTKRNYDLILLDVRMPKMDGVSAILTMRKNGVDTPVITLCEHCDYRTVKRAVDSGALGVLLKSVGLEELVKAVKTVYSDLPYYSNEVSQALLELRMNKEKAREELSELTKREKQVLEMIAKEHTNDEIANQLCISVRTVEGHRKNLKAKLRVKSTIGLVRYAYESGQLD